MTEIDCIVIAPPGPLRLLEEAVRGSDVRIHPSHSLEHARIIQVVTHARVVVAAQQPEPDWLARLCAVTAYGTEAAWVAMLPEFDSPEWLAALESGAEDVLAPPFESDRVVPVIQRAAQRRIHRMQTATSHPGSLLRVGSLLLVRHK